jgi:hypothetical protein
MLRNSSDSASLLKGRRFDSSIVPKAAHADCGRTGCRVRYLREVENYAADLEGVTALELRIIPDISGGNAGPSLNGLSLA